MQGVSAAANRTMPSIEDLQNLTHNPPDTGRQPTSLQDVLAIEDDQVRLREGRRNSFIEGMQSRPAAQDVYSEPINVRYNELRENDPERWSSILRAAMFTQMYGGSPSILADADTVREQRETHRYVPSPNLMAQLQTFDHALRRRENTIVIDSLPASVGQDQPTPDYTDFNDQIYRMVNNFMGVDLAGARTSITAAARTLGQSTREAGVSVQELNSAMQQMPRFDLEESRRLREAYIAEYLTPDMSNWEPSLERRQQREALEQTHMSFSNIQQDELNMVAETLIEYSQGTGGNASLRPKASMDMDMRSYSLKVNLTFSLPMTELDTFFRNYGGGASLGNGIPVGAVHHFITNKAEDAQNDRKLLQRIMAAVNNDPELSERLTALKPSLVKAANQRLAENLDVLTDATRAKVKRGLSSKPEARTAGRRKLTIRKQTGTENEDLD